MVAVTDDAGLVSTLRSELDPLGAQVIAVEPEDCLDAVDVSRAVAVVVDDPGRDDAAIALLRAVRARRPSLPVIYTTSDHSPDREKLVRCVGVLYYAAKPVRHGVLGRLVEVLAERESRRRGAFRPVDAV